MPEKNASLKQANKVLSIKKEKWPVSDYDNFSYYFDKFKQGASLVPRRFVFVKEIQKSPLGGSSKTPLVRGIVSNLDKAPWKNIEPLEAKIESRFLKTVYTGQSIAPFRVLNKNTAIIPWDNISGVIDALEAENRGYTNLNSYLEKVEEIWNEIRNKKE